MPHALALRALGLGDTFAAVPALRALRTALPEHHISLASPRVYGDMLVEANVVDEVIACAGLEHSFRTSVPIDIGVNLHGKGPQSHLFLARAGVHRLVAFAHSAIGNSGPIWHAEEHERARWCRLVGESFGISADSEDIRLNAPAVDPLQRDCVIVHPGAASAARRWPPDRWTAVVAALCQTHPVLITGSEDESMIAADIAQGAGLPRDCVVAGRTSIRELASTVAAARLVVSGDTGVAHMASAYGVQSVLLFGPTPPALWGPPDAGPHTVLWKGTGPTNPHADQPSTALLALDVPEVLSAVSGRLQSIATSRLNGSADANHT